MRLIVRPLAPGETDAELVCVAAALTGGGALAGWRALRLAWPVCFFHAVTGQPCPTCGATRAALALWRGDFFAAWRWNPLALVAYCALLAFTIYALVAVLTRTRRFRLVDVRAAEKNLLRLAAIMLLLVNWTYLLVNFPRA